MDEKWVGKVDTTLEFQRDWNSKAEDRFIVVENRLTALEKKVMWIAGVCAAIGAGFGTVISKFIM